MRFIGIIPAVTTPFRSDGGIDQDGLRANIETLLVAGVHGVVALGTMGESGSMSVAERRTTLATIVTAVNGRVPVIAGISSSSAAQSADYARAAAEGGADGAMLLPPLLYAGDARELVAFYRTVAEATELPIVAYNNPPASGVDLTVPVLARIAEEVERVVAVKECSGDVRRTAEILEVTEGRLDVLVGGDDFSLEGLCAGAAGWISGVADVVPAACVELYDRCIAGELDAARALYRRMLPLARFDMTPKLVQYYKAGLDLVGGVGGPVRPPRMELTATEHAALVDALALVRDPVRT